jgi:hypothetical protein
VQSATAGTHIVVDMTEKREPEKDENEASSDEAASTDDNPPDAEPDSNYLPRQIEDEQDATWFLTP